MPFEIRELRELSAIDIRLWGRVTATDLRSLATRVLEVARQTGLRRALVDCRSYLGGAGFREVLSLTRDVAEQTPGERGREAIITPTDAYAAADVTFYVHTANSLGSKARMFASREAAVAWLTASEAEAMRSGVSGQSLGAEESPARSERPGGAA